MQWRHDNEKRIQKFFYQRKLILVAVVVRATDFLAKGGRTKIRANPESDGIRGIRARLEIFNVLSFVVLLSAFNLLWNFFGNYCSRRNPWLLLQIKKRVKGIGPSSSAWKADILPLNYTRFRKEWTSKLPLRVLGENSCSLVVSYYQNFNHPFI